MSLPPTELGALRDAVWLDALMDASSVVRRSLKRRSGWVRFRGVGRRANESFKRGEDNLGGPQSTNGAP